MNDLGNDPVNNDPIDTTAPHDASEDKPPVSTSRVAISNVVPPDPNKREATTCKPDQTPWWKITLECLAVAVGLSAVAIYGGQLWIMKQQLREMQSSSLQTDDVIKAARSEAHSAGHNAAAAESFSQSASGIKIGIQDAVARLQKEADATEEARKTSELDAQLALNATIDNFHQEQRAWVIPSDYGMKKAEPSGESLFYVDFRNTGKTPSIHTRANINSTADINAIPATDTEGPSNPATLPPEGFGNVTTPHLTSLGFNSIRDGMKYYVYGTIWYEDIFSKGHWTQFCFYVDAIKGSTPCGVHGDTDEVKTKKH